MIAVVTAVLTGATAGLVAILASHDSLAATLSVGTVLALSALAALTRYQHAAWKLAADTPLIAAEVDNDPEPAPRVLTAICTRTTSDADRRRS